MNGHRGSLPIEKAHGGAIFGAAKKTVEAEKPSLGWSKKPEILLYACQSLGKPLHTAHGTTFLHHQHRTLGKWLLSTSNGHIS
jgi:hypothetical protein